MVINIISTQACRTDITGPRKVLINTIKGLDKIGIKYVFNQPINKFDYNWIHDDQKAIIEASLVGKPLLIGPNTAVLPVDLPIFRKKIPKSAIYLHPSRWTIDIWNFLKYNETKLDFWPAGIDLDDFEVFDRKECKKVLVYFKQRDLKLLEKAKSILRNLKIDFELIHYGFYKESCYKKALQECRFGIWIGCSESQGIGLQEALATNLPLIVLDANSLFDTVFTDSKSYYGYSFPKKLKDIKTTTVPYFDERCGIIIQDIIDLENAINEMMQNINIFNPRKYIENNLSLEISAKLLIGFYDQMQIKGEQSYNYQKLSKILFYIGLLFQKWAWKWIWQKVFR